MKQKGLIFLGAVLFAWCGKQAGIDFEKSDFATALDKAQTENKLLLTYFFTEW